MSKTIVLENSLKKTAWSGTTKKNLKNVLRPAALMTLNILAWSERKLWPEVKLHYSPVFIVAPPRSGTTLLYQLMTGHLSTCYFTNLAAKLSIGGGCAPPILSAKLGKLLRLKRSQSGAFESYYGLAKGLGGPHEAHAIWDQRFPEEKHAIPSGYLSADDRWVIYRAVASIERVFDRPFVNKCIRNSVRIEALAEIFPTAIFIQCTRDRLDMAQSIFIARTQAFPFQNSEARDPLKFWFSVKPREYEMIKRKGLIEQVCEQMYYVERSIAAARDALGQDRFLLIDYKDLCQAPRCEIDKVVSFMNEHHAPTQVINPLPDSFPYSTGQKIDQDSYVGIAHYLSQLYGRPIEDSQA